MRCRRVRNPQEQLMNLCSREYSARLGSRCGIFHGRSPRAQNEYVAMNHSRGVRSLVSAVGWSPRVRQASVLSMFQFW